MAISMLLRDLTRAITSLREHFLPPRFDPLGSYADAESVQMGARAFVVFCHAEVEHYLESWAKSIARKAEVVWSSHQKPTKPLLFLMATYAERLAVPQKLLGGMDAPSQYAGAVPQVMRRFYKDIADNHGIKEANCLTLFSPLGVSISAYGGTLLPGLSSFGSDRGAHAHQSHKSIRTPLDPELEWKKVVNLLHDLEPLDQWLSVYRSKIR